MKTSATGCWLTVSAWLLMSTAAAAGDAQQGPSARRADRATAKAAPADALAWNARAAEHLLNRAGFGARGSEIRAALETGPEALLDRWLSTGSEREPYLVERYGPDRGMRDMSDAEQDEMKREVRRQERRQVEGYTTWWFERILSGDDPLRERMTLFWHGFFTSSPAGVRRSYELLTLNEFLRQNALGNYAVLLRGITRDPAMLMYLDNHVNRKESPNENFARELMELFSLGEGNYTEHDVKEAARALTGRASDGDGQYVFRRGQHDNGGKTVLGVEGKLDGDDLVDILLAQDACPRWVAKRLITYLEGVEPSEERLDEYARFLRESDYEIRPFLRKLFLDPEFYREEVLGTRIAGPVDYLAGISKRLGIDPPGQLLHVAATALGQKLLHPPSVKGWDEGMAWISTSTMMERGNFAGMLLGVVDVDAVLSQDDWQEPSMDSETMSSGDMGGTGDDMGGGDMAGGDKAGGEMDGRMRGAPPRLDRAAQKEPEAYVLWGRAKQGPWRAGLNLSARMKRLGARSDAEIASAMLDELLAVDVEEGTRRQMTEFLERERRTLGVADGRLLDAGPKAENVLRRQAHLILSLPEGQLD